MRRALALGMTSARMSKSPSSGARTFWMTDFAENFIVLLDTVIGQRLPGSLASCKTAAVSKDGGHEHVDASFFQKIVEHSFDTLVHERARAELDGDEFFLGCRCCGSRPVG